MKRILFATLLLNFVIGLSFSTQVLANGVLLESVGPVSTGRGATNIAHSDTGSMVYDNPAGLTRPASDRIEFNADFFSFSMHYQDADNDEEGKEPLFILPSLFYTKHFDELPIGLGVGIFNSAGYSTKYDLYYHGKQQEYSSYSSLSKLLVGAGYKITDGVSFGMGIGASYSKIELKMPYTFQNPDLASKIPATAFIDMDADAWSYTWNMGMQWDMSSKTTVGLAYRSQDSFDMQGKFDMDVPALGNPPYNVPNTSAHYDLDFDFRWPQSAGLGLLHRLTDRHILSFDVMWIDWSSAFDELTLKLSN
ncbi:MAG: outer membrane protein transport protein, partial [bacterium]